MALSRSRGSFPLAMTRPSGTSAGQVYTPAANRRAVITKILLTNTTVSSADATVYVDIDGTTYDADSSIISVKAVPAKDFVELDFDEGFEINDAANIAVEQGTSQAILFTILGQEFDDND